MRPALILCLALASTAGCDSPPRAPAISDEPVYQNDDEGLRFLAPAGWSQRGKAYLPPGKLGKERILVAYRQLSEALVATLEVTACDREKASDIEALLSAPAFGIRHWPRQGDPEP